MCSWDWFSMKLLNYFACRPMGFDHKNECFEDPSMSINFQFRPARNYPCKTIHPNSLVSSRFPSKEIISMPREDALAIEDSTEWFIFPPKAHSKLRQSHGQVSGQTNEWHPLSEHRSIITERRDRAWKNETSGKPDSRWRVRKSTKEKPEQRERERKREIKVNRKQTNDPKLTVNVLARWAWRRRSGRSSKTKTAEEKRSLTRWSTRGLTHPWLTNLFSTPRCFCEKLTGRERTMLIINNGTTFPVFKWSSKAQTYLI